MKYRVVYNGCFGGFELSKEAILWLEENACQALKEELKEIRANIEDGIKDGHYTMPYGLIETVEDFMATRLCNTIPRHHPDLIRVVETLGEKASGQFSHLHIQSIKGNAYRIEEYDGLEHVIEPTMDYFTYIEEDC